METRKSIHPAARMEECQRLENLLVKYPEINPEEEDEIKQFLKSADATALGILSANAEIRSQLQRFRRDKRPRSSKTRNGLILVAITVLVVIALLEFAGVG